jgi:hemolysin activation/secretion protein
MQLNLSKPCFSSWYTCGAALTSSLVVLSLVNPNAVQAQSFDPAVRLPQTSPSLTTPPSSPNFRVNGGPLLGVEPGGATFVLTGFEIEGNTLFNTQDLTALVSSRLGLEVDFAALEDIANTISQYYRDAGYPFARAYLPAQDVKDGIVKLDILEGRYGAVTAVNAPAATPAMVLQAARNRAVQDVVETLTRHFDEQQLSAVVRSIDALFDTNLQALEAEYVQTDVERTSNLQAQAFLKDLQSGEVIESRQIERIALILDDIPGYSAVPVIRPGALRGSGDLEVRMIENEQWFSAVGFDNQGSKASGQNRARFDFAKSRNAVFGDLLSFTGLVTQENTWLASLSYGIPINASGLRLQSNLMLSRYKLGEGEFAGLADGSTNRVSLALTYPLIRTQAQNLTLSGGVEHTNYKNTLASVSEKYAVNSIPLVVNFDWRDGMGGGAVTYGSVGAHVHQIQNDERVSRPDPSYSVFSLNVAREQRLGERIKALGRLSLQNASNKIDSSHFISLGGANAVRAYPVGEFSGYRGAVLQGEVSYNLTQYSVAPYAFFDAANAKRMTSLTLAESRNLSGYGVGLRFARLGVNMDLSAAWVSGGGKSVAEPNSKSPRIWFSLSTRF